MKASVVLSGAMLSLAWLSSAAVAQQACVANNGAVPPGANTTDSSAPFFIDTTGLDLSTTPPTRNPSNPNYVKATELPDGTLPAPGDEGNFVVGPTHAAAPESGRELVAIDNAPGASALESATLPRRALFVFGQEGPGLSDEARAAATTLYSIAQFGSTRSINAGVAAGIVMHAWIRQHAGAPSDDTPSDDR